MQLNLNLLTVLDALLEEGSVMGAAERLHLSQPATSRSLGRLRQVTGDQILVRSGRTMTPTPYALAVHPQVHELVRAASGILAPQRSLDLQTLDRTFTIQSHDLLLGTVAAGLLAAVVESAPRVRLRFVAEPNVDASELRMGRVDLQLGGTVPTSPEITYEVLGTSTIGVALRRGHPLLSGPVTAARYAAADHVVVSRRGRLRDQIDESLAETGLTRRVIGAVPTSVDALRIVQRTDVVTTVPIDASRVLLDAFGLVTLELPVSLAPTSAVSSWHQRYDADPAHSWLRSQVRDLFASTSG